LQAGVALGKTASADKGSSVFHNGTVE